MPKLEEFDSALVAKRKKAREDAVARVRALQPKIENVFEYWGDKEVKEPTSVSWKIATHEEFSSMADERRKIIDKLGVKGATSWEHEYITGMINELDKGDIVENLRNIRSALNEIKRDATKSEERISLSHTRLEDKMTPMDVGWIYDSMVRPARHILDNIKAGDVLGELERIISETEVAMQQ